MNERAVVQPLEKTMRFRWPWRPKELEPDFYAEKSDIEVARHINLALLMCQGIEDVDAGFDTVTSLNDRGLAAIARIVGDVRASAQKS